MSSRREVFIRILPLLQRKTLTETKNRRLKCLKWRYLTVRSMKNVAVLMEDRAFAVFLRPHPWKFAIQSKKKGSGGRGGGLAQMQLTDALAFHQCEPPIT